MNAQDLQIREAVASSPGARRCARCLVITQGGKAGLQAHMRICHPEERRL